MLDIRPNCECCDKDLAPDATDAMICTYECTFCKDCVDDVLMNVCPNCGGGFTRRPIRPKTSRRTGVGLGHQSASTERKHLKYDLDEVKRFAAEFKDIAPQER